MAYRKYWIEWGKHIDSHNICDGVEYIAENIKPNEIATPFSTGMQLRYSIYAYNTITDMIDLRNMCHTSNTLDDLFDINPIYIKFDKCDKIYDVLDISNVNGYGIIWDAVRREIIFDLMKLYAYNYYYCPVSTRVIQHIVKYVVPDIAKFVFTFCGRFKPQYT